MEDDPKIKLIQANTEIERLKSEIALQSQQINLKADQENYQLKLRVKELETKWKQKFLN